MKGLGLDLKGLSQGYGQPHSPRNEPILGVLSNRSVFNGSNNNQNILMKLTNGGQLGRTGPLISERTQYNNTNYQPLENHVKY